MTHDPREALEDLQHFSDTQLDRNPKMQKVIAIVIEALTASAPKGEASGRAVLTDGSEVRISRISEDTSPPPAAGWNEAIEACKAIAQDHVEDIVKHSLAGEWVAKGILGRIESLRREAPAPEGVAIAGPINIDPEVLQKDALLDRPDAGGGVREELSAWSSLPRDIYVIGAQRVNAVGYDVQCCSVPMATVPEVRYVRADMIAALSTPPAAAESNASVEARLREALNYVADNTYCGTEWHFKPEYDPQVVLDALSTDSNAGCHGEKV